MIEKKDEPELYLYKYPHYFYPLKLTFSEYMKTALETKMMAPWQDYFIDREKTDKIALKHLEIERPYPFFRKIKEVMPEVDLSKFPKMDEEPLSSFEILAKEKNYTTRFENKFRELEDRIK